MKLDSKIPSGPIEKKWDSHRFNMKLVNPANRRKYTVIMVGTGLAGASAAASLGEMGYNVLAFSYHESPRRAHSIAAQGGINAPKNYANDGDSVWRLFYDTVKGGDYRAREANVYRLAQVSGNIIDQVWRKACRLRATMPAISTPARSAALRSPVHSMHADRQASSFCSVPTRH